MSPGPRTWAPALMLLLTLLPSDAGQAQPGIAFTPVKGRGYREFIAAPTLVSGHALTAVTTLPTTEQLREDVVQVYIPQAYRGEIDLELTTADGYLRGSGTFEGSAPAGSWVSLSIATPRDPQVQSARARGTPETLAVAARKAGSAVPFVVAWGTTAHDRKTAMLRLYVNSKRAEMFVRLPPGELRECRRISGMTAVRFDRVCDVPAGRVQDGVIELVRRDGFERESLRVRIAW